MNSVCSRFLSVYEYVLPKVSSVKFENKHESKEISIRYVESVLKRIGINLRELKLLHFDPADCTNIVLPVLKSHCLNIKILTVSFCEKCIEARLPNLKLASDSRQSSFQCEEKFALPEHIRELMAEYLTEGISQDSNPNRELGQYSLSKMQKIAIEFLQFNSAEPQISKWCVKIL